MSNVFLCLCCRCFICCFSNRHALRHAGCELIKSSCTSATKQTFLYLNTYFQGFILISQKKKRKGNLLEGNAESRLQMPVVLDIMLFTILFCGVWLVLVFFVCLFVFRKSCNWNFEAQGEMLCFQFQRSCIPLCSRSR